MAPDPWTQRDDERRLEDELDEKQRDREKRERHEAPARARLDPVDDVMEGQADLQSVIGRMTLREPNHPEIPHLKRALAFLHRALWFLDHPMYRPARHPDAPSPQPEDADS